MLNGLMKKLSQRSERTYKEADKTWIQSRLELYCQIFVTARSSTNDVIVIARINHLKTKILARKLSTEDFYKL